MTYAFSIYYILLFLLKGAQEDICIPTAQNLFSFGNENTKYVVVVVLNLYEWKVASSKQFSIKFPATFLLFENFYIRHLLDTCNYLISLNLFGHFFMVKQNGSNMTKP